MATSEIEKLERRYAENPQGLTFAPLAEVYRKNGDIPRALELLGPGLERHPEYVPAHIVLGRCRLDLGELTDAEQAFSAVLALDGENVIALKALADINERLARYDEAERWLQALLAVDRNNSAAQEQLVRLEAARHQTVLGAGAELTADGESDDAAAGAEDIAVAEVVAVAAPVAMAAPVLSEIQGDEVTADDGAADEIAIDEVAAMPAVTEPVMEPIAELHIEPASEIAPWAAPSDMERAAEIVPLVLEDDLTPPDEPIPAVEGVELQDDEVLPDHAVAALPGLVTPDSPTLRHELADAAGDFRIETADELVLRPSGASEFQVPDASQDLIAARPEPDPLAPSPMMIGEQSELPAPVLLSTPAPVEVAPLPVLAEESVVPELEEPFEAAAEAEATEVVEAEVVEADDEMMAPVADLVVADVTDDSTSAAPSLPIEAVPEGAVSVEAVSAETVPVEAAPASHAVPVEPVSEELEKPAPIVTETMAEVLLRQGYTADALRIYRELQRRNGGQRLADKIAAIETQAAPQAPRVPAYSARETGGQSVADFLRTLLAARIAGPAEPAVSRQVASGGPAGSSSASTRPATDALSLSAVFGEEASPVPPAVPAGSTAETSFDTFFGSSGPGAGRAPKAARSPEAKDDDLDQFHAWLQNLKR